MSDPRVNFYDLPPEERAAAYENACEKGGVSDFFDLTAEERSRAYEQAEDRYEQGSP